MKTKLLELILAQQALTSLVEKELPIKTSFKINRLIKATTPELEEIEKQKIKLAEKYGTKKENTFEIPKEKINDFNKEFFEFLQTEIEINYKKINIDEFGDSISISPNHLNALEPFFIVE